jgi:hypothetical protein
VAGYIDRGRPLQDAMPALCDASGIGFPRLRLCAGFGRVSLGEPGANPGRAGAFLAPGDFELIVGFRPIATVDRPFYRYGSRARIETDGIRRCGRGCGEGSRSCSEPNRNRMEDWSVPAEGTHHYDLFERSAGWIAQSILIISPYVESKFFKRLVDEMCPESLTVVVDDGCRLDDVQMLQRPAGDKTEVVVALSGAPGLVHSKIFHTKWRTTAGNRVHTLVYGSGNATHQAFGGDFNSELMCWSRLTAPYNSDIIDWLEQVRAAAKKPKDGVRVCALRTELVEGVYFRLPELTVRDASSKADNFDLWLQRGYLLSAYKPDAGFLRVAVPLQKKLPPGDLERRITAAGIDIPQTGRLSIPYVRVNDAPGEGGRWRSQLFTETDLGEWCSETC